MPRRTAAVTFRNSAFTDTATLIRAGEGCYNEDGEWISEETDPVPITVITEPIEIESEDQLGSELLVGGRRFFVPPTTDIKVLDPETIKEGGNVVAPGGTTGDVIEFEGTKYRAYRKLEWPKYIEIEAFRLGQQDVLD